MTVREETSTGRFERLRSGASRLGSRGDGGSMARWLMMAGGALMAIGIAVIILGWTGAAHTPYVFEQTPYLISGGFLGAAIAIIGGLLYFAYWMTRSLEESRDASARTQQALERIEQLLSTRMVATNGSTRAPVAEQSSPFVKTAHGSMFHRPDCTVVAGRDGLVAIKADGEGYEPCGVCDPLALV